MAEKIWAVVQLRDGGLHPMSRETIVAAQEIAGADAEVEAIALGADLDAESMNIEVIQLDI